MRCVYLREKKILNLSVKLHAFFCIATEVFGDLTMSNKLGLAEIDVTNQRKCIGSLCCLGV